MSDFVGTARLTRAQADFIQSPADITLAVSGVRGGKTHVGALACIADAFNVPTDQDQCHAVVSPTYPMSRLGPEAKLHKLLADKTLFPPWLLAYYSKGEHTFFLRNCLGTLSKIRIFTGEKPDRWRGDAWLTWWGDESARLTADAWDVAQGRLADTDGKARFTTTPNGMNFIADLAQECTREIPRPGYVLRERPDGKVRLVSWASTLNAFLRNLSGFAKLKERYDPDFYAQEVLAQFIARTGRVYRWFTRAKHARSREIGSGPIYVGQDFNVARMCSAFCVDLPGDGVHQFHEIEIRDADTYVLANRLEAWCRAEGVRKERLTIVPDASSRKRQTAARSDTAKSDIEILVKAGFRVKGPKANPRVKDRVNSVNGLMYRGAFSIDPSCRLTIEAFEKQPWAEDGEPEKDGVYDNRTDAVGYAVWFRQPLRAPRATLGTERRAA